MLDTEFIKTLKNNDFIRSIVTNNSFSEVDTSQFAYEDVWDDQYKFRNFQVGKWLFDLVEISLTNGNVFMAFTTSDPEFTNELPTVLGSGPTVERAALPQEVSEVRTKVGKFDFEGKIARVSYYISEPYGVAIKINIINNSV